MFRQMAKRREHLVADKAGEGKHSPAVSPGDDLDAMAGDEDAYREGAEIPGAPDEEEGPLDHAALAAHHEKLANFHEKHAGPMHEEAAEEETPEEEASETPAFEEEEDKALEQGLPLPHEDESAKPASMDEETENENPFAEPKAKPKSKPKPKFGGESRFNAFRKGGK
jgi:hypothetical protein